MPMSAIWIYNSLCQSRLMLCVHGRPDRTHDPYAPAVTFSFHRFGRGQLDRGHTFIRPNMPEPLRWPMLPPAGALPNQHTQEPL